MNTRTRVSLWRDGGLRRVLVGSATAFAGGASYAYYTRLPPASSVRAGVACAMLAAPLFAVREVVAASMAVDGPVASAITGGVAGYFGALFTVGPCWHSVSRSAMLMGVGCGFVDVVLSALDWKRKLYLLRRHDEAVRAAADNMQQQQQQQQRHHAKAHSAPFKWPYWFPVVRQIDHEYEDLLRRQRATVRALEEEQARIALLLEALECVKAGKQVTDVELADGALRSSSSSPSCASSSSSGAHTANNACERRA
eukprot:TRINITY_DN173_c0_g1_i15.p9 TRINITY_DN173_c0_g1~~TRINITY_DN173_c0_g1_i15.p9  ORF type:complete len:254 (+),score=73.58 TRINITY_DN173_c0_g1_i15:137-898(+)